MVYVCRSLGCLRKTEETQEERTTPVTVRMTLANADEIIQIQIHLNQSLRPKAAGIPSEGEDHIQAKPDL